ncbi:MAG: Single-stranded DNA-binding protein, partial [uncultured Ramlibacter sp.]
AAVAAATSGAPRHPRSGPQPRRPSGRPRRNRRRASTTWTTTSRS